MTINSGNSTSTEVPTSAAQSNGHSLPSKGVTGEGAPIAIVGMSCKFAGEVTSPSKLWDLCTSAGDAWSPIPHERFDAAGLYDKRKATRGRVCAFPLCPSPRLDWASSSQKLCLQCKQVLTRCWVSSTAVRGSGRVLPQRHCSLRFGLLQLQYRYSKRTYRSRISG